MDAGRLGPLLKDLRTRLKDPLQLRFFVGGGMALAWYVAVYLPASAGIEEATKARSAATAHAAVAREIQALRADAAKFRDRLPTGTDPNEWVEYVLAGVRERPVRLLKLEPKGLKKHGPFSVVILQIELSGKFADLDAALAWIEDNPRLFRVDSASIDRGRGTDRDLILRLTVLGVMG
jgi:hypothetical protein